MYEKYLTLLEEAGKIRNLKERSIQCYKNYVSWFLKYTGKCPEELTCQDARDFLLAKKDSGLKATTLNLYNSAIHFFYRNVLHILWDDALVPRMIMERKLPTVLTADEVDRLLDAVEDLKYKAMFATMYSSGMRVSEVIHLHYDDISRTNMQRENTWPERMGRKGTAIRHSGRNQRLYCIRLVRCDFNMFLIPNRIPIIPLINKLQTKKCTKKPIIKSLSLI